MTFEDPLPDRKKVNEALSRNPLWKFRFGRRGLENRWQPQGQQPEQQNQQQSAHRNLREQATKKCQQSQPKNQIQHVLLIQQTESQHSHQQVPEKRQQPQQLTQPEPFNHTQENETHHSPHQVPQQNDLHPEMNDSWQSDGDAPHRKEMAVKIAHLWRQQPERRTPNAPQFGWLRRLNQMAKELEEFLYRLATSFDEYEDESTLLQRVQMVVIIKQRLQPETFQRDFPCPGLVVGWQSESHMEERKTIVVKIIRFLKSPNAPQEWLKEIPQRTQKLEAILYQLANSLEEYKDENTMTQRLRFLVPTIQLLQQQTLQQQEFSSNQGMNDEWIISGDRPHRLEMVIKIMFIFQKKRPDAPWEWLKKTPEMAKQFEEYLYESAKSLGEYQDEKTLAQRLNLVSTVTIHLQRQTQQTVQHHFLINNQEEGTNSSGWRSDRDIALRLEKVMRVAFLLKQRKPNASDRFLVKLPEMAKQFEEYLYRSATSLDEYQDVCTFTQRLNLAVTIANHLQQQRTPQTTTQQMYFSTRWTNSGWRSDRDMPSRQEMVVRITFLLKQRRPDAQRQFFVQIPEMAIRLEESLYRLANSFDEYQDDHTLNQRLEKLAMSFGIKPKRVQQSQLAVARQQQQDDHYQLQHPAQESISSVSSSKSSRSVSSESREK